MKKLQPIFGEYIGSNVFDRQFFVGCLPFQIHEILDTGKANGSNSYACQ